ncbi:hypothetical protein [Massilia sp. HP4]|uniref:hypothetical protein n=1 Tax=Massilia sp. HP4 TaxID=2562316 RepID=UPI0010C002F7|nr:hypothetical protein [Massilia sp. HP4]
MNHTTNLSRNNLAHELRFSSRRPPLLITVDVVERCDNGSGMATSGSIRVTVAAARPHPARDEPLFVFKESFGSGRHEKLHLWLTDFRLPPSLSGCGVGTFIWSTIHRALLPSTAGRLRLLGGLSANDSDMAQVDVDGNPVWDRHAPGVRSRPSGFPISRAEIGSGNVC